MTSYQTLICFNVLDNPSFVHSFEHRVSIYPVTSPQLNSQPLIILLQFAIAPHTGTPDKRLAIQTPKAINEQVPKKLMNTIISTAAPRGLILNFRCKNFLIFSKYGEIESERANRAGRITLSITVNPAYIPRNAVF